LMTKYKTMIGTTSRNVAIAMLKLVTTHDKRRSLKCLNLSHSCGDRRWKSRSARFLNRIDFLYLRGKRPVVTQQLRQRICVRRRSQCHQIRADAEHIPITAVELR
jgi:hypothetical protein